MEYALEGFPLNGNIQIQAYRFPITIAAFSVTPENLAHSSLSLSNSGSIQIRSNHNRYVGGAIPIKSVAQSELRSNRNCSQERAVNHANQHFLLSGFEPVEAVQAYRHYSAHFEALAFAKKAVVRDAIIVEGASDSQTGERPFWGCLRPFGRIT